MLLHAATLEQLPGVLVGAGVVTVAVDVWVEPPDVIVVVTVVVVKVGLPPSPEQALTADHSPLGVFDGALDAKNFAIQMYPWKETSLPPEYCTPAAYAGTFEQGGNVNPVPPAAFSDDLIAAS